jgi:hypothetical protein
MKDEYIIINKTILEKRIEECDKKISILCRVGHNQLGKDLEITNIAIAKLYSEKHTLNLFLSESTPLIPEIEKAIDFGKDCIREHSYIAEDWNNTPIIEYHDSTEEINRYISNLKLDI